MLQPIPEVPWRWAMTRRNASFVVVMAVAPGIIICIISMMIDAMFLRHKPPPASLQLPEWFIPVNVFFAIFLLGVHIWVIAMMTEPLVTEESDGLRIILAPTRSRLRWTCVVLLTISDAFARGLSMYVIEKMFFSPVP